MARTGFGSRFLLGRRTAGYVSRVLLTLLVLLFGGGFCLGAAMAGAQGLREVLDRDAPMYRLRHVSGTAQANGVFRFSAPLRAATGERPPICAVVHEHYVSGKNGGWRRDGSWLRSAGATLHGSPSRVRSGDGRPLRVRPDEPVDLDPFDPLVVAPADEPWFRTVLADVPMGGRLRAHCVAHGETVFVEGCADADGALTACGPRPLTITTGDGTAQPRIDAHANTVAGQLAGGAAALVGVLAFLWYVVRARPLAEALLRRAGPSPRFDVWRPILGAAAFVILCALAQGVTAWTAAAGSAASRGGPGYLLGILVCAVAGVLALVVRRRGQRLDRAMAPVREAVTVPLRDARGGVVELAVTVREGESVSGVLGGGAHAWVEVRVEETCAHGKSQVVHLAARKCWPARVPVRDASGDGLIDLTHAELDLRSTVKTFKQGDELATALARTPVGALSPRSGHLHWTVEQSVLDPGEALYVLGQCARIEDPKAAGSYRADSTMAVVGGSADARIIVHAGTERSLLRSIGLERSYLDLLAAALSGVAASLALTMLALWAL